MAKELPYFKFEPAEYITKDISFCSYAAQGLFINLCSHYWQRNCEMTLTQAERRFKNKELIKELLDENIITHDNGKIIIKFLITQRDEAINKSKVNSKNGALGGRPKKPKQNPEKTENKPNGFNSLSETKGIRRDKIRIDNINIYNKFVEEVRNGEFDSRVEAMYMRLKLKHGTLTPLLKEFNLHLIENNTEHKTTNEFFINFKNWLNVQDRINKLDKYR
jgi:hypothetical protein